VSDVATCRSTALADRHPVERGIGAGRRVAERRDAAYVLDQARQASAASGPTVAH